MSEKKNPNPFVKWVGGKRSLIKEIHAHLPEKFNNYFEPFVGGGAVFFSLSGRVSDATLADTNMELIITYQVIRKEPERLIEQLKIHKEHHSKEYYYEVRKQSPKDPLEIAARFLYLNKTCFNGLYRVNKSGQFNAPMGSYNNPNIVQSDNIHACYSVLQNVNLKFGDFTDVEPEKGDFVYFDPPYHPTTQSSFTSYTKDNFTEIDQIRLRDFIIKLHKKGVYIMLSNSNTPFIQDIYKAKYFNQHLVYAPRYVNCKPGERSKVSELLITNY